MASETKLVTELRRHSKLVKRVLAYAGDDDDKPRAIAIPERRRKWDQVVRAINAQSWSRIELLNKAGEVLGYVENDGPPGAVEDLTPNTGGAAIAQASAIANLVLVNVRAIVKDVQSAHAEEMRTLMQTQNQVVSNMGSAMTALAESYAEQARVARETAQERAATAIETAAAAAAAERPDEFAKLMESLPVLMQLAGMAKTLLAPAGGASSSPRVVNKKEGP